MPSEEPSRTMTRDEWSEYLDAVAGMGPRETCVKALELFEREAWSGERRAIDLGCGEGRDTVAMLKQGWSVLAVDASGDAVARLSERVRSLDEPVGSLTIRRESFTTVQMPSCELINASFAIPHCTRDEFEPMWARITAALVPGGRFAGQLFGVNDEWAKRADGYVRHFHTRAEVETLLAPFAIEHLEEIERPGKDAMGKAKYWHVFHIVGRKL